MEIRTHASSTVLFRALADAIGQAWSASTASNQSAFCLALPGGRTPLPFFTLLGERPDLLPADCWRSLQLVWTDERLVPFSQADSNAGAAWRAGLNRWPLALDQIHYADYYPALPDAVAAYERKLRELLCRLSKPLGLDLALLGIGTDGHTASLFSDTRHEPEALVQAAWSPAGVRERLTLTHAFLNRSARIYFVATGPDKRPLLEHRRAQPAARLYPFEQIQGRAETVYWLDQDAAPIV